VIPYYDDYVVSRKKAPYCVNTHLACMHKSALRPSTCLLKAMGASPANRFTYAAAGRLDIIG